MRTTHKVTRKQKALCAISCVALLVASEFGLALQSSVSDPAIGRGSSLHKWGAVTLFHGLPSDHVRAIAQDKEGMMWFGTDAGLAKYDGRRIQKLSPEGPAAARVLALETDRDGALWIGGDAGAARLIKGEIKPILETRDSVVSDIISPETGHALMTTEQGEVIECVSTPDGSISVVKIGPGEHPLLTVERRGQTPLNLTSLALIENTLIIGSLSRGLLSIDVTQLKKGATRTPDLVKEILSKPRTFFVKAIEIDGRGRLWFGAETSSNDSGLYEGRDLMRPTKTGQTIGTVTALETDARGNTWVGTDARGALLYRDGQWLDHFTFENTGGGLLSNRIYSIFVDREGVAWFGTDRGVCRYDPHSLRVETISTDAESNFARTLFQSSDGTLWCGTNRGLFSRTRSSSWREVIELKGRVIHSLAEDSQARLYVGTAAGLFVAGLSRIGISANDRKFSRLENGIGGTDNIRAISEFRGEVYIANFGHGIERLDGSKRTLLWPDQSADARQRQVVSLHPDGDRLWIGTAEAGLFLFDGKQTRIEQGLDELVGAAVWSIEGKGADVLWLASARGLYAYVDRKLFRLIEGIDARDVATTSASEHAVWCATVGEGLYRVLIDDDAVSENASTPFLISRLDSELGLASQNTFGVVQVRSETGDDAVWVGTSRGVARYEPGHTAPVLSVTRAMGQRVYSAQELQYGLNLEYPQNSLALDVSAMSSRTFPEQFQYTFSVLDADGKVVRERRSRESQLLIEGLRPGAYRVVARAFTNDLVPSEPLRFQFSVAPAPFPWTSTALSVLLAFALVAMWLAYRQNQRLTETNRQLADTRMQLANETETERRRIARDLHDQTLADLRRLMMLTDQLPASKTKNGHVEPSDFRVEIESISTEIRRICEDLSPSTLANVGLAAALEWALANAVVQQSAEDRFESDFFFESGVEERVRLEPAAQIQVYRIVQEALSNICRHSMASRVRLAVKIDASDLLIELEDNGCGFAANKKFKAGRGLSNIRSRASLIDACVNWSPNPDGGTTFTLRKSIEFVVPSSGGSS